MCWASRSSHFYQDDDDDDYDDDDDDDDGDNWLNPVYNLAHEREARFCRRPAFLVPTLPPTIILCEIPIHTIPSG